MSQDLVKKLREMTQAGILDCSKALKEANGDLDAAADALRKKGLAKAVKKADREAKDGLVGSYVSSDFKVGVLVEVNCETDFVARNDKFQALVANITEHVAKNNPASTDELSLQAAAFADGAIIDDVVKNAIATIGENIQIRRFARYDVTGQNGIVRTYIHHGGKVGVLIELDVTGTSKRPDSVTAMLYDIAMHVAAFNPRYLDETSIPAEDVAKEREILAAQLAESGKPANVVEKIVEGRIQKFFAENCLIHQPFAKDAEKTVTQLLQHIGKDDGTTLKLKRFTRFQLGQ